MNKPEIYLYLYQRFDTTTKTPNTVKSSSSKLGFIYLLLVFLCSELGLLWTSLKYLLTVWDIRLEGVFFSLKFKLKQVFYFYFDLY